MFCKHPDRAMSGGMQAAVPAAAPSHSVSPLGTPSTDQGQKGEALELQYPASVVTAFSNQSTSSSELGMLWKKNNWLVKETPHFC